MERKLDLVLARSVQSAEGLHALHCDVVVGELKHLQRGVDSKRICESLGSWCSNVVDCCACRCQCTLAIAEKQEGAENSQLRSSRFSVVLVFNASLSSLTLSSLRCTTGHSRFRDSHMAVKNV